MRNIRLHVYAWDYLVSFIVALVYRSIVGWVGEDGVTRVDKSFEIFYPVFSWNFGAAT